MHICLVGEEYPEETGWGGIATYNYELAHGLIAAGHAVSVVTLSADGAEKTISECDGRLQIHRVPYADYLARMPLLWRLRRHLPLFALTAPNKVRRIHARQRIDILECAEYRAASVFLQRHREIPVVVRLHTPSALIRRLNQGARQCTYEWAEKRALRTATALSSPTVALAAKAFDAVRMRPRPVTVIANPIQTERFRDVQKQRMRGHCVFVGRLERRKGVEILADALPHIMDADPGMRMTFVGGDGYFDAAKKITWSDYIRARVGQQKCGRIRFVRVPRTQVQDIVATAQYAIFPSIWENFPYVLLESMALGTPAVISPDTGMSEIVDHEENGYILRELSSKCLAEQVLQVLQLPAERYEQLSMEARDKISLFFDSPMVIAQMLGFYSSLLG